MSSPKAVHDKTPILQQPRLTFRHLQLLAWTGLLVSTAFAVMGHLRSQTVVKPDKTIDSHATNVSKPPFPQHFEVEAPIKSITVKEAIRSWLQAESPEAAMRYAVVVSKQAFQSLEARRERDTQIEKMVARKDFGERTTADLCELARYYESDSINIYMLGLAANATSYDQFFSVMSAIGSSRFELPDDSINKSYKLTNETRESLLRRSSLRNETPKQ